MQDATQLPDGVGNMLPDFVGIRALVFAIIEKLSNPV
jgi:hypothetical protein